LLHRSSHLTSINDIFSAPSTYLIPIINKSTHSLARAFTYLCCIHIPMLHKAKSFRLP
jgi:hypothetical protein